MFKGNAEKMKYAVVEQKWGLQPRVIFRTDDLIEAHKVKGNDPEKRVFNTETAKQYAQQ